LPRSPTHLTRRIRVRIASPGLDRRLAAGEDPSSDATLACRSAQLLSKRARRRIALGLKRVLSDRPDRAVCSAALSCNWRAVEIARPALEQLATALRSRDSVHPRGVALSNVLLTEPCSALYQPAYADELYELAREALFALAPDGAASSLRREEERSRWMSLR
jgi:hypothetical protein